MSESDRAHRDDYDLTPVGALGDAERSEAATSPVVNNADAARLAALARGELEPEVESAPTQREYAVDRRRGGGVDGAGDASGASPPAADAPVSISANSSFAASGPPAPLARDLSDDESWAAPPSFSTAGFPDAPTDAEWLAPGASSAGGIANLPDDDGVAGWSSS